MIVSVVLGQAPAYISPLEIGRSDYVEYATVGGYVWGSGSVPVKLLLEMPGFSTWKPEDVNVVMVYPTHRGEVRLVLDGQLRREMIGYMEKVDSACPSGYIAGSLLDVEAFLDPAGTGCDNPFGSRAVNGSGLFRRGVDIHLVCYWSNRRHFLVLYPESAGRGDVDPFYYVSPFPPLYMEVDSLFLLKEMLSGDYIARHLKAMGR